MTSKRGKLFVVSAPSGAGKTSLVKEVLKRLQGYAIERVVTFTSKKPGPSEVQGIDYHFVSEEEFKERIEQSFFIEYSTAYGAYYGFPKSALIPLEEGRSFITILDKDGAVSLKAYEEHAVLIMIDSPSKQVLEERLMARGRDSQAAIDFRLSLAENELSQMKSSLLYSYTIINDEFDASVAQLEALIKEELESL